jgi:hypothetical protein
MFFFFSNIAYGKNTFFYEFLLEKLILPTLRLFVNKSILPFHNFSGSIFLSLGTSVIKLWRAARA